MQTLGQVKENSDRKDLQLQQVTFELRDNENRVKELEQRELFYKQQNDKVTAENSQLSEELLLMRKENEGSVKADTQKADLRDKYNSLLKENQILKKQIESKFSSEGLEKDQLLSDSKSANTLLEAKNNQLENRL